MNKIHLNIKKIALSLLVVGLVISTQAFKSVEKENLAAIYYGFDATSGNYELISGEPESERCSLGTQQCVVIADSENGLDETLTVTEVENLDLQPWSESSDDAQYIFPQ